MAGPDAIDESFQRANPQQLAAAGVKLVMRYLSPPPNSKNLTAPEAVQLHAAGLAILLGYESQDNRALGGSVSGVSDGRSAASYAESIGAPHGLTIYYAVDFDTNPSMYPVLDAYFTALNQVTAGRYKVGVYGEADVIDHLHSKGLVASEWQTYAWSGGRLSANADLYQYLNGQTMAGATVDFDKIIHPELLGAWLPPGLSELGSGTLIEGDDMTPDESKKLTELWNERSKFDTDYFALNKVVLPSLARIEARQLLAASATGAPIDETDLAALIKALPAATVAALKAAL